MRDDCPAPPLSAPRRLGDDPAALAALFDSPRAQKRLARALWNARRERANDISSPEGLHAVRIA